MNNEEKHGHIFDLPLFLNNIYPCNFWPLGVWVLSVFKLVSSFHVNLRPPESWLWGPQGLRMLIDLLFNSKIWFESQLKCYPPPLSAVTYICRHIVIRRHIRCHKWLVHAQWSENTCIAGSDNDLILSNLSIRILNNFFISTDFNYL